MVASGGCGDSLADLYVVSRIGGAPTLLVTRRRGRLIPCCGTHAGASAAAKAAGRFRRRLIVHSLRPVGRSRPTIFAIISSQIDLVRALQALDPPCVLFGGVAEDAVLDGRLTRPHEDVDVLIGREDLPMRLEQVAELGYHDFETWLADSQGRPQVLHGVSNDVHLEISIFDDDSFEFTAPDGKRYVLHLPDGDVDDPPRTLDGVEVRTVSPLALFQATRQGLIEIGAFGPPRPKDVAVHPRLRRLLADVDDAVIAPRYDLWTSRLGVGGSPTPGPWRRPSPRRRTTLRARCATRPERWRE